VIFAERIMQKIDKHVSVSPRTDRLIEASIQWAERIMRKIRSLLPNSWVVGGRHAPSLADEHFESTHDECDMLGVLLRTRNNG